MTFFRKLHNALMKPFKPKKDFTTALIEIFEKQLVRSIESEIITDQIKKNEKIQKKIKNLTATNLTLLQTIKHLTK